MIVYRVEMKAARAALVPVGVHSRGWRPLRGLSLTVSGADRRMVSLQLE